jgi:Xaa-Pro aminopeptidase
MGETDPKAKRPQPVSRINWDGLRQAMDAEGLEAVVAASPENFFYLSDCLLLSQKIIPSRLCMTIAPRESPPVALVCYCEERQMRQDSWMTDIRTYLEFREHPMTALARTLEEMGLSKADIGIERHFLTAADADRLGGELPRTRLRGADRLLDRVRAVKTPAELEILTRGACVTEAAIQATFQAARPGQSEKTVADDLSGRVLHAGATSQWITLAVGSNTPVNHPFPSSKPLTPGEILRVDVGGTFQGYQSDVARTAAIATVTSDQASVYGRLREAQRQTIETARPGVRACDLYFTCGRELEKRGLSMTSQAVGHGLGIGMHEFPVLHGRETALIQAGMVLNMEPAVLDAQGFLYHLEDLFVVTEAGPRILTPLMDTTALFVIR